jgi:uncharacterized protein
MIENIILKISLEQKMSEHQARNICNLFSEGATIPFIARYRKEQTGGLDETQLRSVLENFQKWQKFYTRRDEILAILEKAEKLTDELRFQLDNAKSMQELEDLYLPFKKTRKTKADEAKEKGLQKAADFILHSAERNDSFLNAFISSEKGLDSLQDVIDWTGFIIAEDVSLNIEIRQFMRTLFQQKGILQAQKKEKAEDNKSVFKDYYDFSQPVKWLPDYRILALNRGEKEEILKINITISENPVDKILHLAGIRYHHPYRSELELMVKDCCQRLLFPSLERELRSYLSEKAELRAISIFAKNLRHLFLSPPIKKKMLLAIDPGFYHGCKMALIDENGYFLTHAVIYPHAPQNEMIKSKQILSQLYEKYNFPLIAIGNGTASFETSELISNWLKENKYICQFLIVSESGASVYSASQNAIDEFPQLDVTIRGAISIGRRVLTPLDEFVKIPPESIGVGMYQHDVNEKKLKEQLRLEVESVVNHIGVDINRASVFLMQYVSGLNRKLADNIVSYRSENGMFSTRNELKKVKGLGPKTFELCAGFCRVPESANPFDNTIIHPESYQLADTMLEQIGFHPKTKKKNWQEIKAALLKCNPVELAEQTSSPLSEITFIIEAVCHRKVDPREDYPQPVLSSSVQESLTVGLITQGTVKNVLDFGAFVDIGVKTNGLIHKSKMKQDLSPMEQFYVGQIITVRILDFDLERGRIQLEPVEHE